MIRTRATRRLSTRVPHDLLLQAGPTPWHFWAALAVSLSMPTFGRTFANARSDVASFITGRIWNDG